jgi:hypothetical protein
MNKDLLAAMRRIGMVAHHALEQEVVPHSEVAQSLEYIIEEVTEALNTTKALHALLEEPDQ